MTTSTTSLGAALALLLAAPGAWAQSGESVISEPLTGAMMQTTPEQQARIEQVIEQSRQEREAVDQLRAAREEARAALEARRAKQAAEYRQAAAAVHRKGGRHGRRDPHEPHETLEQPVLAERPASPVQAEASPPCPCGAPVLPAPVLLSSPLTAGMASARPSAQPWGRYVVNLFQQSNKEAGEPE